MFMSMTMSIQSLDSYDGFNCCQKLEILLKCWECASNRGGQSCEHVIFYIHFF